MKVNLEMCYTLCAFWKQCSVRKFNGDGLFDCEYFKHSVRDRKEKVSREVDYIGQSMC